MRDGAAWVVIHLAGSVEAAEAMRSALESEGFLVRIEPPDESGTGMYEILSLKAEAREARSFLLDSGLIAPH